MCKWGSDREVVIEQRVKVDACIADEIVSLNKNGVRTEGSCCGHGKSPATALILPSSQQRARQLGYEPKYHDSGLFEIQLKSGATK